MSQTNHPLEDEPGTDWWVVGTDRLCQIAGILGWVLLAAAGIAAALHATVLTIASLILLGIVLVESSPMRGTRSRVVYFVALQAIVIVYLAALL